MTSAYDLFKYLANRIMADDIMKVLESIDDKPTETKGEL